MQPLNDLSDPTTGLNYFAVGILPMDILVDGGEVFVEQPSDRTRDAILCHASSVFFACSLV